jgi:propanol-preferring alcohol dehydrogenase
VFGIGGLGHLAVRYARIAGGPISAVDIDEVKLDLAEELGAPDRLVNAQTIDPVGELHKVSATTVSAAAVKR